MPARAAFAAVVLLAAALRFPALAARPMHADEAVHADKFGALLEGRGYAYDPSEYHGPTLYYLTLLPAWLRGEHRYVDIDEVTLRSVPAVIGVALVAAHLAARPFLGAGAAAIAALLAAISPAMVYYSRYFVHETLLVFFTFATGGQVWRMSYTLRRIAHTPDLTPIFAGVCAGMMVATKETAAIALVCMGLALVLTRTAVAGRSVATALIAAVTVAALFFSSFLTRPEGVVDAVRAYGFYFDRAGAATWHFHPWTYYLRLLVHSPAEGTPFWTESLILALAVIGAAGGWVAADRTGADPKAVRFLAWYTLLMLVAYSAIPYKTPWCLLGMLHGMILLAGAGAVWLVRSLRGTAMRATAVVLLAAAAAHLGWQAFAASFRFAADPRNPYVYAHTSPDVFEIVDRLSGLARVHPAGSSMPIQIISRENLWPLPFYLRAMPGVAWWTGVSESAPSAPVILITPDMEPALVRKLYDLPPPGERELYVGIFERPVELRPQVELRGYAAGALWDDYRRREADETPTAAGPRE